MNASEPSDTGERSPGFDLAAIQAGLRGVRAIVPVVSGKGGVGKSTLVANLAVALAAEGARVGILDADVSAPAVSRALGDVRPGAALDSDRADGRSSNRSSHRMTPGCDERGIFLAAAESLVPDPGAPLKRPSPARAASWIRRSASESRILHTLLQRTDWGELDVLLVDLPPGAERLPHLVEILPPLAGVLLVSVASYVGALATLRALAVTQEVHAAVLGLIENMAGYHCLACGEVGPLFDDGGDARRLLKEMGIPLIARVPFDPRLSRSTDRGMPFVGNYPDAPASLALIEAARLLLARLAERP